MALEPEPLGLQGRVGTSHLRDALLLNRPKKAINKYYVVNGCKQGCRDFNQATLSPYDQTKSTNGQSEYWIFCEE